MRGLAWEIGLIFAQYAMQWLKHHPPRHRTDQEGTGFSMARRSAVFQAKAKILNYAS
ncbi:hypothetical protein BN874_230002 [Candidatus Contendobacter odensis Run_B_J11]|uniref:Uncharacterized protein n=1 Tax=Candidatus Contendobacter odensis Run_B_J11 TaxID=1400861 RepID=A0A7U7GBM5_9GAMM|nr:hypothetical protein BN874_230002 [Candidatus Contendobacter odensis Run_B_J11]